MKAYSDPLDRLREALRWFMAVRELLLMHVTTGPELRTPALTEIARAQTRPGNDAAIIVCTTPAVDGDPDWSLRSEELAETLGVIAEAAAKAEPPRRLRTPSPAGPGFAGFVGALKRALDALAPAFASLILVLAPEGVEDAAAWVGDLRRLCGDRSLAKVRFIVVEREPAPASILVEELAGLGEAVDIRIDPLASRSFLAALVDGMKTAPSGADPHRTAGMAGPREAPPLRPGQAVLDKGAAGAELAAAGMNPALADPDVMKTLKVEALSANLAMQEGKPQVAVEHQVRARDTAEAAGLLRESTLMQLMLGGYLLQGGGVPHALRVFEEATGRAKALGFTDLEVQAQMATGGTLLMSQRPLDAARAYATGGASAEAAGQTALAIECYRTVGQILLANGSEKEAATAWQRALALAEGAPKEQRISTSAPVAARDLAALYRRHGLEPQARALEEQVQRWEAEVAAGGTAA
jgi:tetratricopeptide (TPR) repeat protein